MWNLHEENNKISIVELKNWTNRKDSPEIEPDMYIRQLLGNELFSK